MQVSRMNDLLLFLLVFKIAFEKEYWIIVVFSKFVLKQGLLLLKVPCMLLLQFGALLVELFLLGFKFLFLVQEAVIPIQSTGVIMNVAILDVFPITFAFHRIIFGLLRGACDIREYLDLWWQQIVVLWILLQFFRYFVLPLFRLFLLQRGRVEGSASIIILGPAT